MKVIAPARVKLIAPARVKLIASASVKSITAARVKRIPAAWVKSSARHGCGPSPGRGRAGPAGPYWISPFFSA